eukprot:1175499-Prorocentrum_minimum.AAC.2
MGAVASPFMMGMPQTDLTAATAAGGYNPMGYAGFGGLAQMGGWAAQPMGGQQMSSGGQVIH